MLFNSYYFIFWFLPIALFLYHLSLKFKKVIFSKITLLTFSVIFYGLWKFDFLIQFLLLILFDYLVSVLIIKFRVNDFKKSKILFYITILSNISFLFYYKYLFFVSEQLSHFIGFNNTLTQIIMPLGISFFTFIQISYLIECYQGKVLKAPSLVDYFQFVTYFPHLIAGPIVLYKELIPQFNDSINLKSNSFNIALGIFIFSIGLFKKVGIADTLDQYSAIAFDHGARDGLRVWLSSLSYTMQLYYDFSGYMDMAQGISIMFNFKLPQNFNSPFKSLNISDYWRRWHITMTRFFMGYVYMPLTIKNSRKYSASSIQKQFFYLEFIPILSTFTIAGIWHGAGWNFVLFGLWHGFGLTFHRLWQKIKVFKIYPGISWTLTFLFVVIGNVFFRSKNVKDAFEILYAMFFRWEGNLYHFRYFLFFFIALAGVMLFKNTEQLSQKFSINYKFLAYSVFLFCFSLYLIDRQIEFLYWQF
jgi:alginate O-acetyltransferase complex protein AlgI